jgi:hypothetical protein
VRHETHAEIALYASAVFGNPTFKTFVKAMRNGWLSNYPDLTLDMLNANKPHTPATALGHITASRSAIRSSRHPTKKPERSPASNPFHLATKKTYPNTLLTTYQISNSIQSSYSHLSSVTTSVFGPSRTIPRDSKRWFPIPTGVGIQEIHTHRNNAVQNSKLPTNSLRSDSPLLPRTRAPH